MVKWEKYVAASENILASPQVPSSLEIISLIKKVNPTRLMLSESDRERGYQIKNRLQTLLLEHYGDSFYLIPHPVNPRIILIKHRVLPTIDACHAALTALSSEAIERVESASSLLPEREELKRNRERSFRETGPGKAEAGFSPKETLKKAQALLEEYDYAAAEEVLAGLNAQGGDDVRVLLRASAILLHEIGAYQCCIDTLLKQPRHVLKDRSIREMLAVAYHHNGSLPEARAILDELYPNELGLEALFAYADITFKDGNLSAAWELVRVAEGRGGFHSGLNNLQKEIELAMSAQAEPVVQNAEAALQSAAIEDAGRLAREALDLFPNCQRARALLSTIEALTEEAEVAELWAKLENEQPGCERRIQLLTTLLERDKEKRDKIKNLLAEEKDRQRQRVFGEQLESLRRLTSQELWSDCFDAVTSLMKQPDYPERAGEILSLSPFFTLLLDNKRLQSTSERNAKELWLRFIKARTALAAGHGEGSYEAFEELKPWFNSCPEFREEYLLLRQHEQEKARTEIAALLADSEAAGYTLDDVRLIHSTVRKRLSSLPIEERQELVQTMEARLTQLSPEQDPGHLLDEYRKALQIGHSEKVAHLRQEITDTAAVKALEAEFAEAFRIDWEPVTLEVSEDLPIDLITPPPLTLWYNAGRRMLLKEGRDTLVMIDFNARAACRMTSPVFSKSLPCDWTEKGSLLFVERKGRDACGDMLWRAELSVDGASFTACFDMREWFELPDGFCIGAIMLSTERDTDYFILISHTEGRYPARVMRKRLAPKGTVETLQMGKRSELKIWRWGSHPDHFIVVGEGRMRHVNRNLSLKATLGGAPEIYGLDHKNGSVYGVEQGFMLTQRDSNLQLIKSFDNAKCISLYEPARVHGISIETDTALIVLGSGRQCFYNLRNNKFSRKIRVGRVIPSSDDGKWYCFDYSQEQRKLWLRDITQEIHTMLDWAEFFYPKRSNKMKKQIVRFHDHDTFVHRPDEWGTPWSPTGDEAE